MGVIYTLVALALVAVIAGITGFVMRRSGDYNTRVLSIYAYGLAGSSAVIIGGIFLFKSATIIDPKHVGVQTRFGKPINTLDNGFHWTAPWTDVTEFDGTIQSLTLAGKEGDDSRVPVRLRDQSVAWVDVTLQWRINAEDKEGVKALFGDYRDPVKVDENFVERNLRAVVNEAFGAYDPVAGIGNNTQPSVNKYGTDALNLLKQRIATKGITLISLTVSAIEYDRATQARIDNLRGLAAEKNAAELRKQIATATAQANNELAKGAKDAGTLYQRCLDLTEKMLREGRPLPPSWSCSGGGATPVLPVK